MKVCEQCGGQYEGPGKRFCSTACANLGNRTGWYKDCLICGKPFWVRPDLVKRGFGKYCGRKCMGVAMLGENNWLWKGGISTELVKERNTPEYKNWRSEVFARDNWTCQDCDVRGGTLRAHHIFPFADYPEHRHEIWNGVTLCHDCHFEAHGRCFARCS